MSLEEIRNIYIYTCIYIWHAKSLYRIQYHDIFLIDARRDIMVSTLSSADKITSIKLYRNLSIRDILSYLWVIIIIILNSMKLRLVVYTDLGNSLL